jgi:hypothetical protein
MVEAARPLIVQAGLLTAEGDPLLVATRDLIVVTRMLAAAGGTAWERGGGARRELDSLYATLGEQEKSQ